MSHDLPAMLTLSKSAATPDPEIFYERIKTTVNPAMGIIKYLHPVRFFATDPDYFCYNSIVASAERFTGLAPNSQINTGIGVTKTLARLAAIGECLERYSSAIYDEGDLIRATYEELCREYPRQNILAPEEVELFAESQYARPDFPFTRFHDKTSTFWTWTHCLIHDQPVLCPAIFIYLPYVLRTKEENFTYTTSTGLAFASTLEGAILAALYEVVERDSLMIMWYNTLSMPKVDLQDTPPEVRSYLDRYFSRLTGRVHCVNITSDIGIPVIYGVMTGDGSDLEPAMAVGAACRLSPFQAFYKGIMEGFQTSNWARHLKKGAVAKDELGEFKVVSFDRHVQYYTRQENYAKGTFSFGSDKKVSLADMPNLDQGNLYANIQIAIAQVQKSGLQHVLVKDLTTEDVQTVGGRVARVFIPNTVPLNLGEHRRALGVRRIFEVPVKMGLRSSPLTIAGLNPAPHPFP